VIFKGRGLAKFLRRSNEAAVNSSAEVYPYVNPPPLFFNKSKAPDNISFLKNERNTGAFDKYSLLFICF
jgi:hypothetical protein